MMAKHNHVQIAIYALVTYLGGSCKVEEVVYQTLFPLRITTVFTVLSLMLRYTRIFSDRFSGKEIRPNPQNLLLNPYLILKINCLQKLAKSVLNIPTFSYQRNILMYIYMVS